MTTITQVTDPTSFYWQALMLQLLQCYLSLYLNDEIIRNCNTFWCVFLVCIKTYVNYCLALPNIIFDGFSDFKFSTQLVSTVVVAAITVFEVRFQFLTATGILYGGCALDHVYVLLNYYYYYYYYQLLLCIRFSRVYKRSVLEIVWAFNKMKQFYVFLRIQFSLLLYCFLSCFLSIVEGGRGEGISLWERHVTH